MENFDKVCLLKCKEKDVLHNVRILCENQFEYLPGFQGMFGKGNRFYFIVDDYERLKKKDIRGKIIK